jgi:hypothetical protein
MKTIPTFLTGALVGATLGATGMALANSTDVSERALGEIVVQNSYFPQEGMEDEVLATRLAASAVRRDNGLVVGHVFRRVDGPEGTPFLIWEARYADAAAREADVAALEETDFRQVSSRMGTLLAGFGRTVWEVVDEP